MGALCSCCKGGGVQEDGEVEMAQQQSKANRWRRWKADPAEEQAKMKEAQTQAGLAAQRREEAFDKSSVGRAARKVAAELAKPAPPPSRGEPVLRWQMG